MTAARKAPEGDASSTTGLLSALPGALRLLLTFGRPHRRLLASGALAAAVVIGCRLALPLLAKVALTHWMERGHSSARALTERLGGDPILPAALACVAICLTLGFADHLERLWFARFSVGFVKDLRRAAVTLASGRAPQQKARADLLARLIGDAARLKGGLKGFLVHVAKGSLLLIGVVALLLWTAPALGGIFALACLLLALTTGWGVIKAFHLSKRLRHKEAKLAGKIDKALRGQDADKALGALRDKGRASGAKVTLIQGRTTLIAHGIFGLAILAGLLVGANLTATGQLSAEQMVVFVLYAFMMRRPMVELARQGARTGKILAALSRLDEVFQLAETPETALHCGPEAAATTSPPMGGS